LIRASFLEIYQEDVRDLLAPADKRPLGAEDPERLEIKESPEGGFYVKGLTHEIAHEEAELHALLRRGRAERTTGATKMNRDSSRSHSVLTVAVESSLPGPDGRALIRVGKLHLVDLAGSERQSKTAAEGVRLQEATKINLSLSALGNVISALTSARRAAHVPYRDSKLTRLLADSLGGNARTLMVANIGPADYNAEETVTTLRFAHRAKSIENRPRVNEDPKDAMLRTYQQEIAALRAELAAAENAGAAPGAVAEGGAGVRVVERVVERRVVKGVSADKVRQLEAEAERRRRELEARSEQERAQFAAELARVEQQAAGARAQLEQQEQALEAKRHKKELLSNKLQQLEQSLVHSHQLLSEAARQRQLLELRKGELRQREEEAERARRLLRQREETQMQLAERYDSQDKELEALTRRLDELRARYAQTTQEIEEAQALNQHKREELLETIRELTRHLQLRDAMLEHLVPPAERAKTAERAFWDDGREEWVLAELDFSQLALLRRPGPCRPEAGRPTSEYARRRALVGDNTARTRRAHIARLGLDAHERTTEDLLVPGGAAGAGGADDDAALYGAGDGY
jgi:kinesin family protein 3/17